MSKFRKAVLSVGTYHSPDGVVVVTAPRLKHWASQVAKLQSTGYAIPMHWDHAGNDAMDLLEPIKMDALRNGKSRSAQNTVGKLDSFRVAADGQSAELTVETLTPSATERAASNAVYVSPVLFDRWKDGAGNIYSDTIGSIDLVDYPVDHSQGPFVPMEAKRMACAIRMSAAPTKLYRLGLPMDDDKKKPNPFEAGGDEGDSDSPDMDNGSDTGNDSGSGDNPQQNSDQAQQTPGMGTSLADVIGLLAQVKIVLPDDTTTANFLERLRPALMTITALMAQPEASMGDTLPPEQQQQQQQPEQPIVGESPQIAAMSLRIRELERGKLTDGRKARDKKLKALLNAGQLTPNEHNALSRKLGVQKLSLASGDTVSAGDIDVWIAARESTPKGCCWSPNERTKRMSVAAAEAPNSFSIKERISKKLEDEAVKALSRK